MINSFQKILKKNTEIVALFILILISVISTTYFNYSKDKIINNYVDSFNNIYFKKTINHFINNLEPRFSKIDHIISPGETFDIILKNYNVDNEEIKIIKETLSKKVNLNKLNTSQKIKFILDQSNNEIKEFTFQISNTEKIHLA